MLCLAQSNLPLAGRSHASGTVRRSHPHSEDQQKGPTERTLRDSCLGDFSDAGPRARR